MAIAPVPPTPLPQPPLPRSPYREPATYAFLIPLVIILAAIAWLGFGATEEERVRRWLWILLLMTAFVVVTGRAITGLWRGILIDARNKMSLSRLQILAWTLLVLSAILTAAMTNIAIGWDSPLNVEVPSALWVVMGISTASVVAAPVILNTKRDKLPDETAKAEGVRAMQAQQIPVAPEDITSVVVKYENPDEAAWSDLLKGDEVGNAAHVDVGKLQMFLFTFILTVGYAAAIAAMFGEPGPILGLPAVEEGMNVLLGISHTGYLSLKAVSHTKEAP